MIGAIGIYRQEVRPFTDKQIELVRTSPPRPSSPSRTRGCSTSCASVPTIESLQQQTATADVLKVISRSTFDLQTVLDTLLEYRGAALRGTWAFNLRRDGDDITGRAAQRAADKAMHHGHHPTRRERGSLSAGRRLKADGPHRRRAGRSEYADAFLCQDVTAIRTILGVPMLREGKPIGVFIFYARKCSRSPTSRSSWSTTFADQAVIAIENTRLFNELRQRTDDLTESLQQQTATADVLKVISRSTFDLQTVLDTLVESAARLCEAELGHHFARAGDALSSVAATRLYRNGADDYENPGIEPGDRRCRPTSLSKRQDRPHSGRLADPEYTLDGPSAAASAPCSASVAARGDPHRRSCWYAEVRPFTDKQIELVTTFADQAVIAIENVRLFDEVQARTDDLSRIAAAADRHRRRAQGHQPLDLRSAAGADTLLDPRPGFAAPIMATISRIEGNVYRFAAAYGFPPGYPRIRKGQSNSSRAGHGLAAPALKAVVHDRRRPGRSGIHSRGAKACGFRSMLGVPLLREGTPIGVLVTDTYRGAAVHRQADRAGHHLRRPGGDRHRERAAVRRNPGQEPPARRGEPAQVAVPRQYEPRAAHAAQRHPRLHRADRGRRLRRHAGKGADRAQAHRHQRQAPAGADQRRARSVQDRGRATDAVARRLFDEGRGARGLWRGRAAGGRKEAHLQGRDRARSADRPRRRAPADAGAAQSRRQRHQVHRSRARWRSRPPPPTARSPSRWSTPVPAFPKPTRPSCSRNSSRPTVRPPRRRAARGWGWRSRKRIVEMHGGQNLARVAPGPGLDLLIHGADARRTGRSGQA